MKAIFQDTREKPQAIKKINETLEKNGYKIIRTKLYVGDYQFPNKTNVVIDRKKNLLELCQNVTQDHKRFKNELMRANELNIKMFVLCEHGGKIKTLEDIKMWNNPRLKFSPRATKGEQLYKILNTLETLYDVTFLFCNKGETAYKIIEVLENY